LPVASRRTLTVCALHSPGGTFALCSLCTRSPRPLAHMPKFVCPWPINTPTVSGRIRVELAPAVPNQLAQRFGDLLRPTAVGLAAVEKLDRGEDRQIEVVVAVAVERRRLARQRDRRRRGRRQRRVGAGRVAGGDALRQERVPGRRAAELSLPGIPQPIRKAHAL